MLVLTTFDADELVLRALRAGAAGFLLKDTPPAQIVRAIELVHAGRRDALAAVTRRLIDSWPETAARRTRRSAPARRSPR